MIKVVLISQKPLPYSKIGSWTTLYRNYLNEKHKIDYIVCPEPKELLDGIKYSFVNFTFISKLKSKFLKRKNIEYFQALDRLINSDEKYIIQVVDNYGMIQPLKKYLALKGVLNNCYIQFFYHGYPPYIQNDFYKDIDEIVLLTNDSYAAHDEQVDVMPNYFSVLPNGIDTDKFKKITDLEKNNLKRQLNIENKKVFLWCSNDRPKKGLHLILEVWKNIYTKFDNIVLLVIGSNQGADMEGVMFLGKMPNDCLPKYYQISDCYLFPTLCEEGFGLSLIEALHCGCYCIASAMGGVPEVLQYGKYGKLIEEPHFVAEWEVAIRGFLEGNIEISEIPDDLYSMKKWNDGMNTIIDNAKSRLENNILK